MARARGARPELLALHQTEAGLDREALAQWELAASNAAARSADRKRSAICTGRWRCWRASRRGERDRTALRLQLLLAARLIATEGYGADAVLHAYLEAQRLCDRIGDDTARFKVEMGLEAYRFMRADFGPALEHGRRAAAIAARSGDIKQRLHAHWGLACTLFHQGELRATMREMEAGLALYTPALHPHFGVQDPGVMCLAYSSWGLWELGRPDSALARINRAARWPRVRAQVQSGGRAGLGRQCRAPARRDRCCACARRRVHPRLRRVGLPGVAGHHALHARPPALRAGRIRRRLGEMRAGYAQWLSTGAMVSRPLYLSLQAEGLLLAGHWRARRLAWMRAWRSSTAMASASSRPSSRACAANSRCGVATRRRSLAEAAYALAMRQHRLGFALRSATSLARLWAARAA